MPFDHLPEEQKKLINAIFDTLKASPAHYKRLGETASAISHHHKDTTIKTAIAHVITELGGSELKDLPPEAITDLVADQLLQMEQHSHLAAASAGAQGRQR
jgi:hypothetical protein